MLPVLGKKAVLEWCMEEGLIGSSYVCPKCGKSMGKKERTYDAVYSYRSKVKSIISLSLNASSTSNSSISSWLKVLKPSPPISCAKLIISSDSVDVRVVVLSVTHAGQIFFQQAFKVLGLI
ncbi:hypothetical protein TNCV_3860231 [Trichonephila clavipes]|nr:hypothetical protein TNCV_3860231 [Trichonephila clavipes]